ncbi:hypothetical protein EW093_10110 [Thiospirochaeta perfilievii]|uniref:Uncharacterized protein n=1 Tax=Thiospirochaeta perfilievii TaxID=252967 RepID=A0A5C1QC60_9SPIO|nr:hypothetical protein [Thiospirochaeta perfilievii]QEN05047.1 hypothetical protein EW093_10110 [Thiospirochaeta perfilievii]
MLLRKGVYNDKLSQLTYNLKESIDSPTGIYLIKGENGVGKSRFIEGVLLKELKKQDKSILYFAQDIENQILCYNLINLVKVFVETLKKQGSFFKTIFLNDDSHNNIPLEFNDETTLTPTDDSKKSFIITECSKYSNLDVVIFDEADKYFGKVEDFITFVENLKCKHIFIISHLFKTEYQTLQLSSKEGGVNIELFNS